MKKLFIFCWFSCSFALLLTGCGGSEGGTHQVRLSEVTHSVFYAPQYVALTQGFFEEEGLEVSSSTAGHTMKVEGLRGGLCPAPTGMEPFSWEENRIGL